MLVERIDPLLSSVKGYFNKLFKRVGGLHSNMVSQYIKILRNDNKVDFNPRVGGRVQ